MSTYREISSLARAMTDESTLSKRREAGRRLEQRLTSARVRQQLAAEAGAQKRQQAMAELWRYIVQNAVASLQKVAHSKSKLTQSDILIPFSIIKCCDIPDESTSPEEAKYQGTFRLTRREMRGVLNQCLELLNDDEALQIAELDLLDMLAYLTASRGYMSYLKSQNEMQVILEEVGGRISDDALPHTLRQKAAEIFQNLCRTCAEVGMEMTLLTAGAVKMVAEWCAHVYRSSRDNTGSFSFAETSPLIGGLTTMLRSNPEQAIAPLTRHGRAILKLTKWRYKRIADRAQRHVLNRYFICHIIVAQTAGELRGLLCGDPGDLGEASLTPKLVDDLLQLVMDRNGELAITKTTRLDEIQQTQLELTARLLACAQRIAVCHLEHERMGDQNQLLTNMIAKIPKPDDSLRRAEEETETFVADTVAVVEKSPFVRLVLKGLHQAALAGLASRPTSPKSGAPKLPMVEALVASSGGENRTAVDAASTCTLLQVLTACAELLPCGACWSSRSLSCWLEIPNNGSCEVVHNRYVHGCDPSDLASVVAVVASILDAHGSHDGDAECQKWALRCLVRLARGTSCLTLAKAGGDVSALQAVWREVWSILSRSDLRYAAFTAYTTVDSVAEHVLWTFSAIAQHLCTDPASAWSTDIRERRSTFLYRRQSDIWNLPVFSLVGETSSVAPFGLIVALLQSAGLSEGPDPIGQGLKYKGFAHNLPDTARRNRLVNFCLYTTSRKEGEDGTLIGAAAVSMSALVHGCDSKWSRSLPIDDPPVLGLSEDSQDEALNVFRVFWGPKKSLRPSLDHASDPDVVLGSSSHLQKLVNARRLSLSSADIMAASQSRSLGEALATVLDHSASLPKVQDHCSQVPMLDDAEQEPSVDAVVAGLKVELAVLLTRSKDILLDASFDRLAPRIAGVLRMATSDASSIIKNQSDFLLEILRIVDFLILVSTSDETWDLPNSILDESHDLAEELEKFLKLELCHDEPSTVAGAGTEDPISSMTARDLDADDLEDRIERSPDVANSRKRSVPESCGPSRKRPRRTEVAGIKKRDAINVVTLLFALKPDLKTICYVTEKLLGVDLDKPMGYHDRTFVDPFLSSCLTQLFTPVLRAHDAGLHTGASFLCRLVRMTRKNAPPHSVLHLFGYKECAKCCAEDAWHGLHPQTQPTADELMTVWTDLDPPELRSRALRPVIRAEAAKSLFHTFVKGDAAIRAHWERDYPKQMLATIFDFNGVVRRLGGIGVAMSLRMMSRQDKVIESMLRNLPPVVSGEESFREWYKSVNGDVGVSQQQAWEDARDSVEFCALLSQALLGGYAAEKEQQESILIRIVEIAQDRRDLEPACFLLADLFARTAGFQTAENMMLVCSAKLIERLARTDTNGIFKIPLLLSAPSLLRFLTRSAALCSWKGEGALDLPSIREHAAKEYLVRNSGFVLPLLLASQSDPSKPDARLKNFCYIYGEDTSDDIIRKLIRGHVSSLTVFAAVSQCSSTDGEAISAKLQKAMEQYGNRDELVQLGRNNASSTGRVFIEQVSSAAAEAEEHARFFDRVADKFVDISERYGDTSVSDPFQRVGLTLSECCIMSRAWVRPSSVDWLNKKKIEHIKVMWSIARRGLEKGSEVHVDFIFLLLSEFCSCCSHSHELLAQALAVLNEILVALTSGDTSVSHGPGFKTELRVLFCTIWRLHEDHLSALLEHADTICRSTAVLRRRSSGLVAQSPIQQANMVNTIGAVSPARRTRETSTSSGGSKGSTELLSASSEVLQTVVSNCQALGLDHRVDLNLIMSSSKISDADRARLDNSLGHRTPLSLRPNGSSGDAGDSTPEIFRRLVSEDLPFVPAVATSTAKLSPHQLLLLSELQDLFTFLSKNHSYVSDLIPGDREMLQQNLSELCLDSPSEICVAACRCLGALQAAVSRDLPQSAVLVKGSRDGKIEQSLEAKCLVLLMDMVKSPRVLSAQIATETIKALLATKQGTGRGEVSARLFSHFVATEKVRTPSLMLETFEVKKLRDCFTCTDSVEWCWDEAFWLSCLDLDFDEWICKLVPALIACHCCESNKQRPNGDYGPFLSSCQRMSKLEPKFASSLFPLLFLQLLQEQQSNNPASFNETQNDAWIGDPSSPVTLNASRCFAAVLQGCRERASIKDPRAVGLLVDTLDMIRRLEQHRFLMSNGHSRNPISMKSFKNATSSPTPPSQGTPPAESQDYPFNMEPTKWMGIPFGVGVFINGIHLAEACFKVKRFYSGLFYAEHYCDVRFGGSTRNLRQVIEHLSRDSEKNHLTADISGFPVGSSSFEEPHSEPDALIAEAKAYFGVLARCTNALNERDHLAALLEQSSDIRLMREETELWSQRSHTSPTENLRIADSGMALGNSFGQNRVALDSLSELHLYGTLQASIEGLTTRANSFDGFGDGLGDALRDKWYEGCLFGNSESFTASPSDITHRLSSSKQTSGFCESVFMALQSLSVDDYKIGHIHIDNARFSTFNEVIDFATAEGSSSASISLVDKLNCLNELEDVVACHGVGQALLSKWKGEGLLGSILDRSVSIGPHRFDQPFTDRVQELVLQLIRPQQEELGSRCKNVLSSLLWRNAEKSCRLERIGDAQAYFQRLSTLHGKNSRQADFLRVRHLEARIMERKGDFSSAIRHVSQSLDRLGLVPLRNEHDEIRADLMVCCGRWMATHRVDSGGNVLDKFLRPGLDLARKINETQPSTESARRVAEACIALGNLVFSVYETVSARVKSPEWKTAGSSLRAREVELDECNSMVKSNQGKKKKASQQDWDQWLRDLLLYRQNLSKDIAQIKSERSKIERSIGEYKALALRTLIEALSAADDSYGSMSKYVYRMISLWFLPGLEANGSADFDAIPSYRFVPLANQLFSRLSASNDTLKRLTARLCADHPYHCLAQMVRLGIGTTSASERDKEKAGVAQNILHAVKAENHGFLDHLVENYESLLISYIFLAEASTQEFVKTKKINFSAIYKGKVPRLDQSIGKGSRRRPCPPCVLTKPPALRPRCDYGGGIDDPIGGERIDKFEDNFAVADSGITRPKIVICNGSKGGRFKQLVKGGDDCRGDAVMQQVFEYVNELFALEKTGRDRHLRIVTYTIQPTSPTTGVLEWVEDTLPFGDYLTDRGKKGPLVGAHSRYFPGEWGGSLCREYLKNAPRGKKKEAFETICKFHSPVFRFFFVERFGHSARDWFEAKTRYTRSVAVSSFVGHILGIGDRHANNILVHQKTGEVVHIDFGIVFEQGKLLQVPERVPFRLTRNIVDGFGPTGTEGRFTTTSQQTMKALKQNSEALLTILSAITADPLYRWSLNPKVERKREELLGKRVSTADKGKEDQNETASQAVRKVKEKLSGYEDGTAGEQQSTEGQVHFLINSARDLDLLSQMYPGWAPYT